MLEISYACSYGKRVGHAEQRTWENESTRKHLDYQCYTSSLCWNHNYNLTWWNLNLWICVHSQERRRDLVFRWRMTFEDGKYINGQNFGLIHLMFGEKFLILTEAAFIWLKIQ